jgi:hypothetical protein
MIVTIRELTFHCIHYINKLYDFQHGDVTYPVGARTVD